MERFVQAAAALVLWRSRQFNTYDIAKALGCPEAEVCTVIYAAKERERGPDLFLAHGGTA